MAKGKHATKAGNRLAQLDSEIVQSLKSEVAKLNDELSVARLEVQAVQRRIYADAQRLGHELSRDAVAAMRERLQDGEAAAVDEMRSVGEGLVAYFTRINLIPTDAEFTALMSRMKVKSISEVIHSSLRAEGRDAGWNRKMRRFRTSDEGMIDDSNKQDGRYDFAKKQHLEAVSEKLGAADE